MKERPILFNIEMINAILDERKTQTRRLKGIADLDLFNCRWDGMRWQRHMGYPVGHIDIPCPYGEVGDRLWIRETWAPTMFLEDGVTIQYKDGTELFYNHPEEMNDWHEREWIRHSNFFKSQGVKYDDSLSYDGQWVEPESGWPFEKWHPSIFMPKFVARIWLEILQVSCERLQDITLTDSLSEGIDPDAELNNYGTGSKYRDSFAALWDSINKKRGYGWNKNPWVWVIKYKRMQ